MHGDEHFFIACRYVERNTLRANLVERAEQWRWSSLYRRRMPKAVDKSWLADWPLEQTPTLVVAGQRCGDRSRIGGLASLGSNEGVRLERRHGRLKWCVGSDLRPLFGPTGDLKSRERTPDTLSASLIRFHAYGLSCFLSASCAPLRSSRKKEPTPVLLETKLASAEPPKQKKVCHREAPRDSPIFQSPKT